jgi:hypothetical protein
MLRCCCLLKGVVNSHDYWRETWHGCSTFYKTLPSWTLHVFHDYCRTSFYDSSFGTGDFEPLLTSSRASHVVTGNKEMWNWGTCQRHNIYSKYLEISQMVQKLKWDTHTQIPSYDHFKEVFIQEVKNFNVTCPFTPRSSKWLIPWSFWN